MKLVGMLAEQAAMDDLTRRAYCSSFPANWVHLHHLGLLEADREEHQGLVVDHRLVILQVSLTKHRDLVVLLVNHLDLEDLQDYLEELQG